MREPQKTVDIGYEQVLKRPKKKPNLKKKKEYISSLNNHEITTITNTTLPLIIVLAKRTKR